MNLNIFDWPIGTMTVTGIILVIFAIIWFFWSLIKRFRARGAGNQPTPNTNRQNAQQLATQPVPQPAANQRTGNRRWLKIAILAGLALLVVGLAVWFLVPAAKDAVSWAKDMYEVAAGWANLHPVGFGFIKLYGVVALSIALPLMILAGRGPSWAATKNVLKVIGKFLLEIGVLVALIMLIAQIFSSSLDSSGKYIYLIAGGVLLVFLRKTVLKILA